jgi:hypothetical protein
MPVDLLQEPLESVPVCLVEVSAVDLRDVREHVVLGIVEDDRGMFCLGAQVGVVEHVGYPDVTPLSAARPWMKCIQNCPHPASEDVSLFMQ